jgi:hypothetical protein
MKNKRTILMASLALITAIAILPILVSYAAPTLPPPSSNVDANFSSIQLPIGPKMTAPFGKYVGVTAAKQGNIGGSGGYAAAQVLCNGVSAGSHVCSAKEIINSYEYNIALPTGKAWVNNGPPAYVSDVSNDCNGWSSNNNNDNPTSFSVYGSIWNFDKKQSLMATCGRSLPFACCSY